MPRQTLNNNQSIDKISYIGSIQSGGGQQQQPWVTHIVAPGHQSLANLSNLPGSAIGTMDRIVSALPQPKRPNTTAKAATKKEEGAKGEPAKKATGSLTALVPEKKLPPNETNESALKSATAWSHYQQIQKKFSVGQTTTTKYHERAAVFEKMNEKAKEHVPLLPQSNYFGQSPDPAKDPYDRRKVKQLDDISFEESEEE